MLERGKSGIMEYWNNGTLGRAGCSESIPSFHHSTIPFSHSHGFMLFLIGLLLAEADPHVEVFDLLHNTLGRLDEADCPWPAVLAYYQWRLLKLAGLLGELAACASCGREIAGRGRRDMHFSSTAGGLLCGACEGSATEKYRLDGRTTAGIAAMAAAEAGKKVLLPAPQAQAVNRLLLYHVTQQTGKAPRMGRHAIP